jgi:hypothetical protein
MRDFLASRVVDGRQQIRTSITFHEYGRLVMWPYGYTYTDVPADMTTDDRSALMTIGRHMAATNGYHPEQASDLYLTSGTTRDYLYGTYRTFAYTFELQPRTRTAHRGRDGPQQGRRPVPHGACAVPAERARSHGHDRSLWCLRRRPGGPPRLGGEPGRDRHGADDRPLLSEQPGFNVVLRRQAAWNHDLRVSCARDRFAGRYQRTATTLTDDFHPLGRDQAASTAGQKFTRYVFAHDSCHRFGPASRGRGGGDGTRTPSSASSAGGHGRRLALGLGLDGRMGRPSTCASRPWTAARTTSSRSRSTTSGSRAPPDHP